jgi:hypothetical protein
MRPLHYVYEKQSSDDATVHTSECKTNSTNDDNTEKCKAITNNRSQRRSQNGQNRDWTVTQWPSSVRPRCWTRIASNRCSSWGHCGCAVTASTNPPTDGIIALITVLVSVLATDRSCTAQRRVIICACDTTGPLTRTGQRPCWLLLLLLLTTAPRFGGAMNSNGWRERTADTERTAEDGDGVWESANRNCMQMNYTTLFADAMRKEKPRKTWIKRHR